MNIHQETYLCSVVVQKVAVSVKKKDNHVTYVTAALQFHMRIISITPGEFYLASPLSNFLYGYLIYSFEFLH